MQLRTYLRIEGELVSHVTEKVEREVELSALLDEVVRNQPISTGRLPCSRPTGPARWPFERHSSVLLHVQRRKLNLTLLGVDAIVSR
jgi:hypothetical protein